MAGVGVYEIRCVASGMHYIGSTEDSFFERLRQHRNQLIRNAHANAHLQAAWNKYGPDAFRFRVVERVESGDVRAQEQKWIDTTSPQFNKMRKVGQCPLGQHVGLYEYCAALIKRIVVLLVECHALDAFLNHCYAGNPSRAFFGLPLPERLSHETRSRMSLAGRGISRGKGRPKSPQHRAAQSKARKLYVERMRSAGLWPPSFYTHAT